MKRVAAIGDNCIDVYEKLGKQYPTGNVVNTAVHLRRLGAAVSLISTTGSDDNGRWMLDTMTREGLDISRLKVADGPTAITRMDMNGTDRVHGEYIVGVLGNMVFGADDVAFAAGHDLVHSAFWGRAESVLPDIRKGGARISFDYADNLDSPLVDATTPVVDYGFFSYKKPRDAVIENYLRDRTARGMKIAVATFGEHGSLAFDGRDFYAGRVFPATVVNTIGAGDSFIGGFLWEILNDNGIDAALETGARVAAEVVSVFWPWAGFEGQGE